MQTGTSLESRPKLATFSINETENRTYEDVGKFVASFRPNSSSTGANLLLRGNSKQVSSEYKSEVWSSAVGISVHYTGQKITVL